MITTSASSPRPSLVGMASGESPTEGPRVVISLCPVDFSNAGPRSLYTLKNPAEIITLMSSAIAALAEPKINRKAYNETIIRGMVQPQQEGSSLPRRLSYFQRDCSLTEMSENVSDPDMSPVR